MDVPVLEIEARGYRSIWHIALPLGSATSGG
jgi:hypothetical protein